MMPIADCQLPNDSPRCPRSAAPASPHRGRGFTLIEMLTTVAVLIIVLGLMVSLARNVRDQSAQQLTKQLLRQLAVLMNAYHDVNHRMLPEVTPIIPEDAVLPPEDPAIELLAKRNNEQFVRALRHDLARLEQRRTGAGAQSIAAGTDPTTLPAEPRSVMGQLPVSVYDGITLRDAWGSPIVFMPTQHRWIGMAPKGREGETYFFFSAGPDRRYLTRDDNLYSYETVAGETP